MKRISIYALSYILFGVLARYTSAYSPIFPSQRKVKPNFTPGIVSGKDIEIPDFEMLFYRIYEVSPLAKAAVEGKYEGFSSINDSTSHFKWKEVEAGFVRIDKLNQYQGINHPLLRFRSSFVGPCTADLFANMIMEYDLRKEWDKQIAEVVEVAPAKNLNEVNKYLDTSKHGSCSRLGVGYCRTKASIVSSREQLTLCGVQSFPNGSHIIWGKEMPTDYDHYMPSGSAQHVRAYSHLFATTMIPTSSDTFDVEYVLQLESGGSIPSFLTTPIIQESVKQLFRFAKDTFEKENDISSNFERKHEDTSQETLLRIS